MKLLNNNAEKLIDPDIRRKYNLDLLKKEESVRGEFVRNALKELEGRDEDYILRVIEYGVAKLWL